MTMRMLIDARHLEETRVAVVKGSRIEEFDFESAEHKQLKGNIYLAKVTRVEPSLQAAFIDYGGNRHGFLAFSEIHPDYYQIPKADRDALLREEAEHAAEEERLRGSALDDDEPDDDEPGDDQPGDDDREVGTGEGSDEDAEEFGNRERDPDDDARSAEGEGGTVRPGSDESAADELRERRQALRRRYKIQDVIQRRQVLLIQVVKEERGNKGAALTTYLSLAGRYCVLMPNTSHGGGISRKIPNGADRKRLKSIMADMKLPSSMGIIVRTAGLSRTKSEIKRDFDYLARLWDEIRERTLTSAAPALIYRDSDLIKRAIRDLYHREIDEVEVEGEDGYRAARGFMKLLMPSHVRRVKLHADSTPLFQRSGVEDQLSAMYQPVVQLKSGGYLVINPTEALVSIDINSGRSTREHNIEQTAFATNLEAAAEIARQLRLRDMAGLVVIDFIDMEQSSHVRKVEKAMKDALKNDRARIQVGRISSFGLMEMSRQRLRTGVLEASTKACPHCDGTGLTRTASSAGLSALRMIEDEAARGRGSSVQLRAGREAAIFVLNRKRAELAEVEQRYGVTVEVAIDESLEGARMSTASSGPPPVAPPRPLAAPSEVEVDDEPETEEIEDFEEEDEEAIEQAAQPRGRQSRDDQPGDDQPGDGEGEGGGEGAERGSGQRDAEGDRAGRRRRRRRRGGRGRNRPDDRTPIGDIEESDDAAGTGLTGDGAVVAVDDAADQPAQPALAAGPAEQLPRRRARSARPAKPTMVEDPAIGDWIETTGEIALAEPVGADQVAQPSVADEPEPPRTRRRPRARKAAPALEQQVTPAPVDRALPEEPPQTPPAEPEPAAAAEPAAAEPATAEPIAAEPRPRRRSRAKPAADQAVAEPAAASQPRAAGAAVVEAPPERPDEAQTAADRERVTATGDAEGAAGGDGELRRGWWQRTFG